MPPLANIQTAAFTKLYKFQPCQEVTCFNYFYLKSLAKFFGPCIVLLSYWSSSSFEGPRIETGRVYQKFIRNGRRTSSIITQIFVPIGSFGPGSVAIKLTARNTTMSLILHLKTHINVSTAVKKIVRRTWCLLQRPSLSSR